MRFYSMKTGLLSMATLVAACALFVWTGCKDDHDHENGNHNHNSSGGHTSPYPSCNEITAACHEVDVEEGPIHDCHDKGHAATSDEECAPIKAECLRICNEARVDAGLDVSGH